VFYPGKPNGNKKPVGSAQTGYDILIQLHIILISPEIRNENDDDVIELISLV